MNLQQRFLYGALSGTGSVVIKTMLNLLFIPVFLATLGVSHYGLFVLLISFTEIAMLLDLGLTSAIVQALGSSRQVEEAQQNHQTEKKPAPLLQASPQEVLSMGHTFYVSMAVIVLIIGLLTVPQYPGLFHIPETMNQLATTAFTLILIESAITIYMCYYRAVLLAHCLNQWSNVADSGFHIIIGVGGLIALLSGFDLITLLEIRLVAAILRLGFLIYHANQVEPSPWHYRVIICWETLRELLRLSFHASMVNISVIVSHKIDTFVIALFLPLQAVGVYEIVFRFLSITLQVAYKICEGIFPLFSRLIAVTEWRQVRRTFLGISHYVNYTVTLLLLLTVLCYNDLFQLLTAHQISVEETWPILAIAVPCIWSGALQMPASYFLYTSGRQRFLSVSSILAALANLALSLILVQPLGLVGVALGTLIPQFIQHQLSLIRQTCDDLKINLMEYIFAVHIRQLVPLTIVGLWVLSLQHLLAEHLTPIFLLGFIGGSSVLIGILSWTLISATDSERRYFDENLLTPIKRKLPGYKPATGAAPG